MSNRRFSLTLSEEARGTWQRFGIASNGPAQFDSELISRARIASSSDEGTADDDFAAMSGESVDVVAAFDDHEKLASWESWVRSTIVDFETITPLVFSCGEPGEGCTIHYRLLAGDGPCDVNPGTPCDPPADPPTTGPTPDHPVLITILEPSLADLKKIQLHKVEAIGKDVRRRRLDEIIAQSDGALEFFSSVVPLSPQRTPWTLELVQAAIRLAIFVEMRFKHAFAVPRPIELSPRVHPIIDTPGHGSYPSGHAAEAFVCASVLWQLLRAPENTRYKPRWGRQLMRLADRIATNRTIAGVHYPVDSAAGAVLGLTLADYFVARCKGEEFTGRRFDATRFDCSDFAWTKLYNITNESKHVDQDYSGSIGGCTKIAINLVLHSIWENAQKEWK